MTVRTDTDNAKITLQLSGSAEKMCRPLRVRDHRTADNFRIGNNSGPQRPPGSAAATGALRLLVAVLLVIAATACSTAGPAAPSPAAPQASPPAGTPDPTAAAQPTAGREVAGRETAEQVIARLAEKVGTARLSVVYDAATDPNELLGTPGAYTSKAAFTDTRIDPAGADDTELGSVELGGSVEVFPDETDARARKQYLDETIADLPIDVSEYSYVDGPVLLRVSRRLTPEQAAEYEAALQAG